MVEIQSDKHNYQSLKEVECRYSNEVSAREACAPSSDILEGQKGDFQRDVGFAKAQSSRTRWSTHDLRIKIVFQVSSNGGEDEQNRVDSYLLRRPKGFTRFGCEGLVRVS
jgi:hypothetical protein